MAAVPFDVLRSSQIISAAQAAAGTSVIGHITMNNTAGLVATSHAAMAPVDADRAFRPIAKVSQTRTAPEIGVIEKRRRVAAHELRGRHEHRKSRRGDGHERWCAGLGGAVAPRCECLRGLRPGCTARERHRNLQMAASPQGGLAHVGKRIRTAGRPGSEPHAHEKYEARETGRQPGRREPPAQVLDLVKRGSWAAKPEQSSRSQTSGNNRAPDVVGTDARPKHCERESPRQPGGAGPGNTQRRKKPEESSKSCAQDGVSPRAAGVSGGIARAWQSRSIRPSSRSSCRPPATAARIARATRRCDGRPAEAWL